MGIITVEKVDYLLWLGRYMERTYTTINLFKNDYDEMIDHLDDSYMDFCIRLQIPNIYTSKEDFIERYAFDETNSDSIISNLTRAYDNAIYLRDEIGTQTMSYIQMAIYDMQSAKISNAPIISLQRVVDNILAFWGCIYDQIGDSKTRSIIKLGKRVERLDLYLRFRESREMLLQEIKRLGYRLAKTALPYNIDELDLIHACIDGDEVDYEGALKHLEAVFEV